MKDKEPCQRDARGTPGVQTRHTDIKKEGARAPFKNGSPGKEGSEGMAYPTEAERAAILARTGGGAYSENELRNYAKTIKAKLPCPSASPGKVAVMLARHMVTEDECRVAGVTW